MSILNWLTWCVRVTTANQLTEFSGAEGATPWRRLESAQLIERISLVVAVPIIGVPLTAWHPGRKTPALAKVAWQLEKRRQCTESSRQIIFHATEKATRLVGGCGGGIRQPMQIEHDLGTTATYLRRRALCPDDSSRWLGEDVLRLWHAGRGRLPDAMLFSVAGERRCAIEYGGEYSLARLQGFHHSCARRRLAYEIW